MYSKLFSGKNKKHKFKSKHDKVFYGRNNFPLY